MRIIIPVLSIDLSHVLGRILKLGKFRVRPDAAKLFKIAAMVWP